MDLTELLIVRPIERPLEQGDREEVVLPMRSKTLPGILSEGHPVVRDPPMETARKRKNKKTERKTELPSTYHTNTQRHHIRPLVPPLRPLRHSIKTFLRGDGNLYSSFGKPPYGLLRNTTLRPLLRMKVGFATN